MPLVVIALAASAASGHGAVGDEFRPDLIRIYESDGGRNIPNYRYDAHHTAGGVCQMTDETWREVAPTVDIDIVKFPNAGSASEHQQWQACWKLHAMRGNQPWTCCNPYLKAALEAPERAPRRRLAHARAENNPANLMGRPDALREQVIPVPPHEWDVFPDAPGEKEKSAQADADDGPLQVRLADVQVTPADSGSDKASPKE